MVDDVIYIFDWYLLFSSISFVLVAFVNNICMKMWHIIVYIICMRVS